MTLWNRSCTAALALCLAWVLPAPAQDMTPDVVLARADADASGGWPVVLWIVDGDRSSVVISAPRAQLGDIPGAAWAPVDANALMALERFGAPRLVALAEPGADAALLDWERPSRMSSFPPYGHWPGERLDLRHAACAGDGCAPRQAWRIELPPGRGETLPLARLLPQLGADAPAWLVLHVVSRHALPGLMELRYLAVPAPLQAAADAAKRAILPADAAAQFPAIHTAMLMQLARAQGREATSTLMRADDPGPWTAPGYVRSWHSNASQRAALGLQSLSPDVGSLARLLLRLHPADRPATLSLLARQADGNFATLRVLLPAPADVQARRDRVAALRCEPACAERLQEVQVRLARGVSPELMALGRLTPTERLLACLQSCEFQKRRTEEDLPGQLKSAAQRQALAWRWVESLTGRTAAEWQQQP